MQLITFLHLLVDSLLLVSVRIHLVFLLFHEKNHDIGMHEITQQLSETILDDIIMTQYFDFLN